MDITTQKESAPDEPERFEFPPVPFDRGASNPRGDEVGAHEQGRCLPVKA